MTRLVLGIALAALAACSSHGPTPEHPEPAHGDAGTGPVATTAPSEAECDAMFDHAIALQAEPGESTDDRAKLRAELRGAELPRCRAMPRERYACAMAAATLAAFTACDSP